MTDGKALLRGVIVPLVTPMSAPGVPDAAAAEKLVSAIHASGVDGLMLLGSNGEGPLLGTSSIGTFATDVAAQWRSLGGGPILVNVTAPGTAEALARTEAVLGAQADALVLSAPFYFRHRDDEVVAHYAAFADIGVPVVAYNIPRYSTPLTATSFDGLLDMEHVVGIKDSSGDLTWLTQLLDIVRARRPEFGVSQGAESQLVAGLEAGADGTVPGIANIAPALAVELWEAARRGDAEAAATAQTAIDQLCKIHQIRPGVPSVKEILSWQGLCPLYVAAPLATCTPDERAALRSLLEPWRAHLVHA